MSSTASRWAATASRRSSPAASRATSAPPRRPESSIVASHRCRERGRSCSGTPRTGRARRRSATGFLSRLRDSLGKSRRALVAELGGVVRPGRGGRMGAARGRADPRGRRRPGHRRARPAARGARRADRPRRGARRGGRGAASASRPCSHRLPRRRRSSSSSASTGRARRRRSASSRGSSREHGRSVLVGAADTFRAAAEEQLEIWAERAGADFVGGSRGADPAAVAFDALEAGRARGTDVVIVDTAGRLHTQGEPDGGAREGAPRDRRAAARARRTRRCSSSTRRRARTGSSRHGSSADAAGVTGVALTKLDGSAKGGVAIAIAHELRLPVKLVGVGEGVDDLRPFDARDFARALVA